MKFTTAFVLGWKDTSLHGTEGVVRQHGVTLE